MEPLEQQLKNLSRMPTGENPIETTENSTRTAPAASAPQPLPQESYEPGHKGHLAPVRTFNSDLADAIRNKGGSVVRIAIEENERHQKEELDQSIKSKKNMAFVIFGIVVVLGAIIFAGWSYYHNQAAKTVAPTVTAQPSSLVSSETSAIVNVSGMQIPDMIAAIQKAATDPTNQSGTVKNIVITQGTAGAVTRMHAQDFLTALGMHAPASFTQAILPDYMIAAYTYGTTGNLFIIMHGTAHDFLLAGMLDWEPYLFNDMTKLFNLDTSSFTASEIQNPVFQDTVISNRDARAVIDSTGKPLFFYSFLDPNTIIFATDPKTLTEVVRRS